jgi:alpha-1,3-rhamnosyl/mannosyltransferase
MQIGIHTADSADFYPRQLLRALLDEMDPPDGLIHYNGSRAEPVTVDRLGARFADPTSWQVHSRASRPRMAQTLVAWWSGLGFEQKRYRRAVDVSHAIGPLPAPTGDTPVVPLLRDLGPLRHPEAYSPGAVKSFEQFISRIDAYPAINTLSAFARDELASATGIDRDRVAVTGVGVDDLFRIGASLQDDLELQAMGLLPGDFFLCVGTLHGLCNIRRLTDAYAALPDRIRAWLPLVVAGRSHPRMPRLSATARAEIEAGNIRLLGQIPQSLLGVLYRGARLALFPAFYGGVGTCVAEALVCGAPVAVSSRTAAVEIAGPRATILDPLDVDAWRSAMADHAERGRFNRVRAIPGNGFRWRDVATRTMTLYRKVARRD